MDPIRYPVGKFEMKEPVDAAQRTRWMEDIAVLANRLGEAVAGLDDAKLDTPYREGGWTVRQIAHHVADAHMQFFIRFKLALTEDHPTIKGFHQDGWAELADAQSAPVTPSLSLIAGVSDRWIRLARTVQEKDFSKTFYHPGYDRIYSLDACLGIASWHGRHHAAQIAALRERMGWQR